jgi:hypothetical protein
VADVERFEVGGAFNNGRQPPEADVFEGEKLVANQFVAELQTSKFVPV